MISLRVCELTGSLTTCGCKTKKYVDIHRYIYICHVRGLNHTLCKCACVLWISGRPECYTVVKKSIQGVSQGKTKTLGSEM